MDFIDQLQAIAEDILKQNTTFPTDEETKNKYVLSFILALGYDVFDAKKIIANFADNADSPKGGKVDITELRKLSKHSLQSDRNFTFTEEVNSIRAIKNILIEQSISPSAECIRFLAGQLQIGILSQQILNSLAPVVKEAFRQFVEYSKNDSRLTSQSHNDSIITDKEFEALFVVDVT